MGQTPAPQWCRLREKPIVCYQLPRSACKTSTSANLLCWVFRPRPQACWRPGHHSLLSEFSGREGAAAGSAQASVSRSQVGWLLTIASFPAQTPPPPPAAVGVTVTPGESMNLTEVQGVPREPNRWREKRRAKATCLPPPTVSLPSLGQAVACTRIGMVAACVWHVTCVKVHVRGSALCSTCAMCVPNKRFLLLLSATVA